MVEVKNGKKILTTPISAEDLKDIKIGDIVYLNGSMTTCRDVAHRRLVEEGRELPVDVRNNAIFHAGPIIRPLENDKFEMVSVGPTTSMRMEKFEYEFVKETGVRVIIGKGGMKENTERACKEFGAIHCVFPAGNAVVAATEVEEKIGHPVGGVCPFALNDGVEVYLDESLKNFETVFPACGATNNAIEISIEELEKVTNRTAWVDVTKEKED